MDAVSPFLSAAGAPDQAGRLLRLYTPLGAGPLVPATFAGVESVDGAGFRFEITALSTDAGLSLDALLGAPVLLQLLTADAADALRPFHGHVTLAERQGSNGGLARYRLVIEPWLALLEQRVDSYVFHDMSVVEIVEDIFADHVGQGSLQVAWRWELADRGLYTRRSLTTQYQESELMASLVDVARTQKATLADEPERLPAQESLKTLQTSLAATTDGSESANISGVAGTVPGWSAPVLLGSDPAGVVSLTPADQVWVSGTQTVLSAGGALNWMSQGHLVLAVAGGLVLYTQGGTAAAGAPNQETGIALHAAQGTLSARAHRNQAMLAAKTEVRIASTQGDIELSAPAAHVLATAAGAYLRIEGDNIELGAPGTVEFKGSRKEWLGPQGAGTSAEVPKGSLKACPQDTGSKLASGAALV